MKKRYFGLDIGQNGCFLTLLEYEKKELRRASFLSAQKQDVIESLTELFDSIENDLDIRDRIATAIPSKAAFVRKLELPIRDRKKIAAAVPFSLSSQIPVTIESCATSAIVTGKNSDGGSHITAAAIPQRMIESLLETTGQIGIPLHVIDLKPFSLIPLVTEKTKDAVLIGVDSDETTISLIRSGELTDYRLLPKKIDPDSQTDLQGLAREIRTLKASHDDLECPVLVFGTDDTSALVHKLNDLSYDAKELTLQIAGDIVPSDHIHATALAYRMAGPSVEKSFNFRQGAYALKGEWQKLKRALWVSVALITSIVLICASAAFVQYQSRKNRLDQLQTEMTQVFQQTFPTTTVIVDIPLQMKSNIQLLRENASLIGSAQAHILPVLEALSEAASETAIEFQELSVILDDVSINGSALSFDAIDRMAESLKLSPLFKDIQVSDAQMALQGDKIDFRLSLQLNSMN